LVEFADRLDYKTNFSYTAGSAKKVDHEPSIYHPCKMKDDISLCKEYFGLIRASDLQQTCTFRLRSGFGYASASIISFYLTIINHLFTNTYKSGLQTVDPKVARSSRVGLVR